MLKAAKASLIGHDAKTQDPACCEISGSEHWQAVSRAPQVEFPIALMKQGIWGISHQVSQGAGHTSGFLRLTAHSGNRDAMMIFDNSLLGLACVKEAWKGRCTEIGEERSQQPRSVKQDLKKERQREHVW